MIPNKLDRHAYASVFLAIPSRRGSKQVIEQDESKLDTSELYVPELVLSEGDGPGLHTPKLDKPKQNMEQNGSDEDEMDKPVQDESDQNQKYFIDEDEMDTLVQGKSKISLSQLDITVLDMSQLQIYELDKAVHKQIDKVALRVIVDKFVLKAQHNSKLRYTTTELEPIMEHLWELIWTEVKNKHFVISRDTCKHLHGDVYQALCKEWSCKGNLMTLLSLQEPLVDTYITATFKKYLTLPKDHSFTGTMRTWSSSTFS